MKENMSLSVQEKLRRNPLGWLILFCLSLGIFYFFVWNNLQTWIDYYQFHKTESPLVADLSQEVSTHKRELATLNQELEELWKINQIEEGQIFPKTVDTHKIATIFEMYALQLKNLTEKLYIPYFELQSVHFGRTQTVLNPDDDTKNHNVTDVTLSFETDEVNFKDFVVFLQTGRPSIRIHEGAKPQSKLVQEAIYQYLKDNLVPLLHIDSIQYEMIQETQNADTQTVSFAENIEKKKLRVNMNLKLFSQAQQ